MENYLRLLIRGCYENNMNLLTVRQMYLRRNMLEGRKPTRIILQFSWWEVELSWGQVQQSTLSLYFLLSVHNLSEWYFCLRDFNYNHVTIVSPLSLKNLPSLCILFLPSLCIFSTTIFVCVSSSCPKRSRPHIGLLLLALRVYFSTTSLPE